MSLDRALHNSISWYTAVLRAHGIVGQRDTHAWWCNASVPLYYSNLITITAAEGQQAQRERLRALAADPPKPEWGVKDSFDCLDLSEAGMASLFQAHWYAIDAGAELRTSELADEAKVIETPDELAAWEAAWGRTSPAPGRTFPPSLLDDAGVTFVRLVRDGTAIGGFAANTSDDVVGLSNVYADPDVPPHAVLRDAVRALRTLQPHRTIVGYAQEPALTALGPVGARILGPLRVWIST